ncbi:MAG: cupin domain-containing protein [Gammaproteobacteria bacterium]|nr:cupin domain-containing protein [Gammaproteobacteria bacterium]
MKTSYKNATPYQTKDNSIIRELLHPENNTTVKNQSLAEATVLCNQTTAAHFHKKTEEIYFILKGNGKMFLDDNSFDVSEADSILIKPGQIHCIKNTGNTELKFLCCCSPAYQHEDTFLIK